MLRRRMLMMLGTCFFIVLLLAGHKAFSIYQQVQVYTKPRPPVSVAIALSAVASTAFDSRIEGYHV